VYAFYSSSPITGFLLAGYIGTTLYVLLLGVDVSVARLGLALLLFARVAPLLGRALRGLRAEGALLVREVPVELGQLLEQFLVPGENPEPARVVLEAAEVLAPVGLADHAGDHLAADPLQLVDVRRLHLRQRDSVVEAGELEQILDVGRQPDGLVALEKVEDVVVAHTAEKERTGQATTPFPSDTN
jgi:hypothetical protein